jgi:diguanylate cyclase (GGDEF)-like protein
MNPAPKTSSSRPAGPQALALPQAASGGRRAYTAVAVLAGAVVLGSAAAFGLVQWFGAAYAWAAPAAAALGVLLAGLPLGLMAWRLAGGGEGGTSASAKAAGIGLARPLFMDLAEREWARARRYGSGAALVLIDVDRYARLCEARGPQAGDSVLAELLRQTAPTLRPADILTRYSETQMAVLLAHADATGALDVAERIRERAEQLEVMLESAAAPPQRLRVTISAGVAHLRPAHLSLQSLVDDAEDAVMAARQAGGNCVRAAPVEPGRNRNVGTGRDERRARPKQGGPL